MDLNYILSQIFIIIMYVFLAISYLSKSKRTIVLLSSLALLASMFSFLFLNAWTGFAACIVDLFRNFYLLWAEKKFGKSKKTTKRDVIFLLVVLLALVLVSIPTYDGILSLCSIVATAIYTFSIWQKSTKIYKACGIPVSIFWVTYHAYTRSIFGVILESVLLVVSAVGFGKELKSGSKANNKRKRVKSHA